MADGALTPYLQIKRFDVARPWISGAVLDVGCGEGDLAAYIEPARYVGWDSNPERVSIARERFPRHTFSENRPAIDQHLDTICDLAVIEHIQQPCSVVADWLSSLRPDGRLVLTTPHRIFRWAHEAAAALRLAASAAVEEHEEMFTRESLLAEFLGLNLYLEKYSRFLFGMNQLFVFRKTQNSRV